MVGDNSCSIIWGICSRSPLGYEQYDEVIITRQVVIGGKNKYLINGANVQVSMLSLITNSMADT